jgi:hypothetical protein
MTDVERRSPGSHRLVAMLAATVLLTVGAALLGTLGWAVPTRTSSGWQVTDVPAGLLAVLLGTAGVSLVVAALLARPDRLGRAVAVTWWAMAAAAVFALVWNDLYLAALKGGGGAIIPVFDWLFTFVPALVVGLVARRLGPAAHQRATLGIAVLTLPMSALGWAVTSAADTGPALTGALYTAGIFGAVPLAMAVFLTRARRPEGVAAGRV